jgi:hypothetical protein
MNTIMPLMVDPTDNNVGIRRDLRSVYAWPQLGGGFDTGRHVFRWARLFLLIRRTRVRFWPGPTLVAKVHAPRLMRTIWPATAAALVKASHPLAGYAYTTDCADIACVEGLDTSA